MRVARKRSYQKGMFSFLIKSFLPIFGELLKSAKAHAYEPKILGLKITMGDHMSDKTKWMAAIGYILVIADSFSTQLFNFFQFYLFGYYINLVTVVPIIIYYSINKSHADRFIVDHLKRSVRVYFWYIAWSVVSGVLFESNNLWIQIAGVGVTWLMIFVLVYVSVSCGKGIIRSFKEEPAPTKSNEVAAEEA